MATDDHPSLDDRLRAEVARQAGSLGLEARSLTVQPILNWGGFVNRSFAVTDGRVSRYVKLAAGDELVRGLDRWRRLSAVLTDAYRAPAMLGWIELPGTEFAGPVFEWIEGTTPARLTGRLRRDVPAVIRRLHADEGLAAVLVEMGDAPRSSAAVYLDGYHDRFVEDLKSIRADRPPFVATGDVKWMADEADRLAVMVRESEAFAEPASAPAHQDLWLNNLLVTQTGRWYFLDWDQVGLGDPVMDWAMLFGPTRADPTVTARPADVEAILSETAAARLAVYARASLLDWVIDPLADWIEAQHHPAHQEAVRTANRRVHERALAAYRERYGTRP